MHRKAADLELPELGIDGNAISRYERGDNQPGLLHALLMCSVFHLQGEQLGLPALPFESRRGQAGAGASADTFAGLLDGYRLPAVDGGPNRDATDPRLLDELQSMAADYAERVDQMSPATLMPLASRLLEHQRVLLRDAQPAALLDSTCQTAIVVGWLSYNLNNRGDADAYWTYAENLAHQMGSAQLQAHALGVRSTLFSTVPSHDATGGGLLLPIALLDQAIRLSGSSGEPSLRAWLHARRAEERATIGDRRGAYNDIESAQRVLSGGADGTGIPLFREWKASRLKRYHGSAAQLLGDHASAIDILEATLLALHPSLLPQRTLLLVDLARAYTGKRSPEPDRASTLLEDALSLAEQGGLGEGIRRVVEARKRLHRWAGSGLLEHLDVRLRVLPT
jgi:tetratricopeptide (TPR) repeat protein